MKIYSPCKNTLTFRVNSRKVELPPGVTNFLRSEAEMAVNQFGRYGVVVLPRSGQEAAKKAAQETWMLANREWAEGVLVTWHESNKLKMEAGVPVEPSEDVKAARKILGVG